MVGTVLISMKVMPDSPDLNLEELKKKIAETIEKSTISAIFVLHTAFARVFTRIFAYVESRDR